MAKDAEITERLGRIDEIIDQLNAAECDRDEGEDLYEEGQRLLRRFVIVSTTAAETSCPSSSTDSTAKDLTNRPGGSSQSVG